jgi:D5 N terminal like
MTSNTGLGAKVISLNAQRPPEFSDEALAICFAERHAGNLRHIAEWDKWMAWEGTRWCFDKTLHAFDRARQICRDAASQANDPRVRMAVASAKTVYAVARLARTDRRLAATTEQWDANPWLLNTRGGIVDLHTGEMRPARIDDYVTKITAIAPGGTCPTWDAFLRRVTGDDPEMIAFLCRMCGYALTGITHEHALILSVRNRCERQEPLPKHRCRRSGRLSHDGRDRDFHRLAIGAPPHRPRRSTRRPARHSERNRGGAPLG